MAASRRDLLVSKGWVQAVVLVLHFGFFVLGLLANPDDAAIVSSTIGLSKQLGLSVISEGVEDRATADFLVRMGCEEGQGYFFGRPMPASEFEAKFLAAPVAAEVA